MRNSPQRRFYRSCAWATAAVVLLTGCVQRRMVIRSNPPGAAVYVDGNPNPIGTTPVARNYTYYGVREFRMVKDGYETKVVKQPISPPWYEWFGLDFVSENLVPGEIRDYRTFDYQLEPQKVTPSDQLVRQGEALRQQSRAAAATQMTTPPGTPLTRNGPPLAGPISPSPGSHSPYAPPAATPSFPSSPQGGYATPPSLTGPTTASGLGAPPSLSGEQTFVEQPMPGSSLPVDPPGGWQPRN